MQNGISKKPVYESGLIKSLLKRESTVRYYLVQSRVKEYGKFEAKLLKGVKDKKYAQPENMTDFAALRVICYLRQDKEIVAAYMTASVLLKEKSSHWTGVWTK